MQPVVLLDTNVWVSAFLNKQGHPARLIQAWHDDAIEVIAAFPILEEIGEVLRRPHIRRKYRIQEAEIARYLELITAGATIAAVTGTMKLCRDPDDDVQLEAAIAGKAEYLVILRFLGVESALDYRVEEYDPNRRAVLVGTAATVTATDTVLIEPRRGGCRVTWDADIWFAGPLRLLDPVFAWLFASSVRSAIANLRRELGKLRRRQSAAT